MNNNINIIFFISKKFLENLDKSKPGSPKAIFLFKFNFL